MISYSIFTTVCIALGSIGIRAVRIIDKRKEKKIQNIIDKEREFSRICDVISEIIDTYNDALKSRVYSEIDFSNKNIIITDPHSKKNR